MQSARTSCPPDAELADFGLGKLDAASAESVSQHLEICADCRQRVASLSADSFVGRLRQAGPAAKGAAQRPLAHAPGESLANAASSTDGSGARHRRDGHGSPSTIAAPPELANHADYELLKELGQGGMGTVYLARNRMMERLEVLKVISTALLDRPGALDRFQQEIRSAAKLAHPNVVAAYRVLRPGNFLVFAMEYVRGQDLSEVVKQRGPLPVTNATYYIHQVANGLQHAFEKGMVHRDIKPNNLILSVEGKKHVVKILDFGLARANREKDALSGLTKSGQMLGTPDFIAPEQILDARQADVRADIYSLGCTLYFLLSGNPPFQEASLYGILEAHQKREARPLNLVRSDVPVELATVVAKMMAKNPGKRYQTPNDVAKVLVPFFKPGQIAAAPTPDTPRNAEAHPQYTIETVERSLSATPPSVTARALPSFPQPVPLPIAPVPVAVPVPAAAPAPATNVRIDTQRRSAKRRARWSSLPPWQRWSALGAIVLAVCFGVTAIVRNRNGEEVARLESREGAAVDVKLDEQAGPNPPYSPAAGPSDGGDSAFQQWLELVRSLPAEKQVPAVVRKLQELNPGFDGQVTHEIEEGIVTVLTLNSATIDKVRQISPLRALDGLKSLTCRGAINVDQGRVSKTVGDVDDLSALAGLRLSRLDCMLTNVADLSPLSGMPLTDLNISHTRVLNLSSLAGMSLTNLDCSGTSVKELSPLKGMPITSLRCDFTQVRDLSPLAGMPLTALQFISTPISDLSPLKGAPLTDLRCMSTDVSDLSPLRGKALTILLIAQTRVSDLAPLAGMRLEHLNICYTPIADLSPLAGMPLTNLWLLSTNVTDLSPLAGMPLEALWCDIKPDRDAAILRSIKTLATINNKPVAEFWDNPTDIAPPGASAPPRDAGANGGPPPSAIAPFDARQARAPPKANRLDVPEHARTAQGPSFDQWIEDVRVMPAEKQVEAVAKKLQGLNPGFDGRVTHKIENGAVTELKVLCDKVEDITPVSALTALKSLSCFGTVRPGPLEPQIRGALADLLPLATLHLSELECLNTSVTDLSPIKAMPLTKLNIFHSPVSDLSPLVGMPLTHLDCGSTNVADLSALKGMPLTHLVCVSTSVNDLSPLKGMPLTHLFMFNTKVDDLSALAGMPLKLLNFTNTRVSDLSPLKGMPLEMLFFQSAKVSDLSPLMGMPLGILICDIKPERDATVLRSIKTLTKINGKPAAEFWNEFEQERKP